MTEKTWVTLAEGLAIYKMKQSKNWYIRFRYEGVEYPAKSLRTADQAEATAEAFFIYKAAQKKIETEYLQPKSQSLGYICKAVEKNLEIRKKEKSVTEQKKIQKENLRYIKILRALSAKFHRVSIKDFDYPYLVSFYNDYQGKISTTELRYMNLTLKKIFDYALAKRLINTVPAIPKIKTKKKETTNHFNKDDYQTILNHLKSRKKKNGIATENNTLLYRAMQFITDTGVRAGTELTEIQCKDLQIEEIKNKHYWTVRIKGGKVATKDGLKRKIVLSGHAILHIKEILLSELPEICRWSDNELKKFILENKERYIFRRLDGKIPDYPKLFNDAICQIEENLSEAKVTLYSGRHSFITNQLKRGANINIVAKHCGTSVEMIEKHYNHLLSMMKPDELLECEYILTSENSIDLAYMTNEDLEKKLGVPKPATKEELSSFLSEEELSRVIF
ncbi:site-specific integrase [Shewanella algae]|uniref:site-specific integrase n=1 Tax=Shewanella algae TaxID=38313 RepID=UPI003004B0A4